jgi:tRNA A37 methylthiotransferase MiaB
VISKERNALMRELFHQSAIKYREKQLGQILQVLWEKAVPVGENQWNLSGLSSNYLRVKAKNSTPCRNQLMSVVIIGLEHGDLVGEISAT